MEKTVTEPAVIDEQGIITKYGWRSGKYHNVIKTREEYYEAVHKFVEKYGEVLEEQLTVYHNAGGNPKETIEYLGCGWNTENLNSAVITSKPVGANVVFILTIPKGAKVVKFEDDEEEFGILIALEDEAVVDMKALGLIGNSKEAEDNRDKYGLMYLANFDGKYDYMSSDWLTQEEWDHWCLDDEVLDHYEMVDVTKGVFRYNEQVNIAA